MSLIQEVLQGFIGGLIAGIMGYAADLATSAIFEAFVSINPLIPILGFVFSVITFFAGISESYATGIFFSLGIIAAGYFLGDFVTFASGLISIIGLVISFFRRSS